MKAPKTLGNTQRRGASGRLRFDASPDAPRRDRAAPAQTAGADDALSLYLKQMGAIRLLSREEEVELSGRLERARRRFRRAAMYSPHVLGRLLETFEEARAG